jgi:hypothetical protein
MPVSLSYKLERLIPCDDCYDIVVAGGGPAGSAAAICAARLGVRVLLIEALGSLGGTGANGMVSNWYAMSDGEKMLVRGLFKEIIETLYDRGDLPRDVRPDTWLTSYHKGTGFNPEGLKILLDELCLNADVELRFMTRLVAADADPETGRVSGVIVDNIEGLRYVPAKAFIDATGDAVLSKQCGAVVREAGRDTKKIMPPTLCSVQTGINWDPITYELQQEKIKEALKDGFFSQYDRHVPGLFRTGETTGILNAGHLFGMDALDNRSLTEGYIQGRRFSREYTEFYRRYVPGCEKIKTVATASLMGVRESRRILGEYELTYADFRARRQFTDQIGVYCKAVDIHVYDTSDEEYERYLAEYTADDDPGVGECYGVPYRILVPKGWSNLWVAGRCNSSDIKVNGALRDQPAAYLMGQAAGTAAVQSIKSEENAGQLDVGRLQETLRGNGAYIPKTVDS